MEDVVEYAQAHLRKYEVVAWNKGETRTVSHPIWWFIRKDVSLQEKESSGISASFSIAIFSFLLQVLCRRPLKPDYSSSNSSSASRASPFALAFGCSLVAPWAICWLSLPSCSLSHCPPREYSGSSFSVLPKPCNTPLLPSSAKRAYNASAYGGASAKPNSRKRNEKKRVNHSEFFKIMSEISPQISDFFVSFSEKFRTLLPTIFHLHVPYFFILLFSHFLFLPHARAYSSFALFAFTTFTKFFTTHFDTAFCIRIRNVVYSFILASSKTDDFLRQK